MVSPHDFLLVTFFCFNDFHSLYSRMILRLPSVSHHHLLDISQLEEVINRMKTDSSTSFNQ